jgi:uncharacterized RmlC-like cupin family protein
MPSPARTCQVIKPSDAYQGKQALNYFGGVSAENCGAQAICMHLLALPPGQRAKAHLHENHETAIYVLRGKAGMWYGDGLSEHMTVEAGDFLYIPAGMPHQPYNPSETDTVTAVIARTDPNEQESVVLLPALDAVHSGA